MRLAFLLEEEGEGEGEGGGDNPVGRGEGGEVPLSKVVCSVHCLGGGGRGHLETMIGGG